MKTLRLGERDYRVEGEGQFFSHLPEGAYDDPNIWWTRRLTPAGGTFYDIGANIGLMSLGVSDVAGKVVAVEPSPSTYEHLVANTRMAGVHCVQALIARSGDERVFLDNTACPTGSTSLPPGSNVLAGHDYLKASTVRAISLDDLIAEYGPPGFVKIDVEGCELEVLDSGTAALQRYTPTCLIEFNALCLMNFGRVNPPEALERIKAVFPYVYRVEGRSCTLVADNYVFIMQNILQYGSVNDLLCSFRPIEPVQ